MFVHPGSDKGTDIFDIVRIAIPSTEVLDLVLESGGCTAHRFREAWPHWYRRWTAFISQNYRRLGHWLGRGEPPPLPED